MDLGSQAKKIYIFFLFLTPGCLISIHYALFGVSPHLALFFISSLGLKSHLGGKCLRMPPLFLWCSPSSLFSYCCFFFFLSSCLINYQTKRSTKWCGVECWSVFLERKKKTCLWVKRPCRKALTHPEVWVSGEWKKTSSRLKKNHFLFYYNAADCSYTIPPTLLTYWVPTPLLQHHIAPCSSILISQEELMWSSAYEWLWGWWWVSPRSRRSQCIDCFFVSERIS